MEEPERTASVAIRNVFTSALLSNYRQHGGKEGAQKKETERKTEGERQKRELEGEEVKLGKKLMREKEDYV